MVEVKDFNNLAMATKKFVGVSFSLIVLVNYLNF